MKTLSHNNREFKAEKIIKTNTAIFGYNPDSEKPAFSFKGISDFSEYQIAEGQVFDSDPEAEKEQRIIDLELAVASILGGV